MITPERRNIMKNENKIMILRKKLGLSQEELAEKVGVARQTISKWELDETSPDLKQAKKLSQIFKISLDELVDNDIKDITFQKVSNTEKLAGLILKAIKFIIIIIVVKFLLQILLIVYYRYLYVPHKVQLENIKIECNLQDKIYNYEFEFESQTGYIRSYGGDSYLGNITDVEKYNDVYKALDIIDEYVINKGGYCRRLDSISDNN